MELTDEEIDSLRMRLDRMIKDEYEKTQMLSKLWVALCQAKDALWGIQLERERLRQKDVDYS
jgi:hypothetical protein